jgi:hypothetical protein
MPSSDDERKLRDLKARRTALLAARVMDPQDALRTKKKVLLIDGLIQELRVAMQNELDRAATKTGKKAWTAKQRPLKANRRTGR